MVGRSLARGMQAKLRFFVCGGACLMALGVFPSITFAQDEGMEPEEPRSNHYRALTKIRTGSVLRRRAKENDAVDLRSRSEKLRDMELVRHYRRLAQLEVILEIATSEKNDRLVARIDRVRMRELKRHRIHMDYLQKSRGHLSGQDQGAQR